MENNTYTLETNSLETNTLKTNSFEINTILCYMCGSSCDFHSQICDICKRSPPSPPWFCDEIIDENQ